MTYTVVWTPGAEDRLCELWLESDDRPAISKASDEIDLLLHHRPYQFGEIRQGGNRLFRVEPLEIYYKIFDDDRRVEFWAVWLAHEG